MIDPCHRRRLLQGGAMLAGGLLLPTARACEVQAEFLRITHPWSRATAPDAAFGVLCMLIDAVTADERLIGVECDVAGGVALAGATPGAPLDLPIPAGSEIDMHDRGVHLQLAPLRMPLFAGRSYPLTLTFARSGTVLTTLSIDYPRFL